MFPHFRSFSAVQISQKLLPIINLYCTFIKLSAIPTNLPTLIGRITLANVAIKPINCHECLQATVWLIITWLCVFLEYTFGNGLVWFDVVYIHYI